MFDLKIIILREIYTIHYNTVHRIVILHFYYPNIPKKKKTKAHIKTIIIF